MKDTKFMNCISCQKEIKREWYDETDPMGDNYKLNQSCWKGGDVNSFSCGYGSDHDTSLFYICICDDCITKGLKENSVIFIEHYM